MAKDFDHLLNLVNDTAKELQAHRAIVEEHGGANDQLRQIISQHGEVGDVMRSAVAKKRIKYDELLP